MVFVQKTVLSPQKLLEGLLFLREQRRAIQEIGSQRILGYNAIKI